LTVKLSGELWLSVPEVPVTVSDVVDAATFDAALNEIATGAAVVTWGDAGEIVTPEGSPLIFTVTAEAKPFDPEIETVTEADSPPVTVMLPCERESEKSGTGGGFPPPPPPPDAPPPPHPTARHAVSPAASQCRFLRAKRPNAQTSA
jgi:hypothetical protein